MSGVSYGDAIPRPYDVALFLCSSAIREILRDMATEKELCRAVVYWYMDKLATLHLVDESLAATCRAGLSAWNEECLSHAPCAFTHPGHKDEIDFSLAVDVALGDQEEAPLPHSNESGALCFDPDNGGWAAMSGRPPLPGADSAVVPTDDGFALIVQLLTVATTSASSVSRSAVSTTCARTIVDTLLSQRVGPRRECDHPGRGPSVDTATLDLCFCMDEEAKQDSVLTLGSATKSFHAVVCIAWGCASFQHQAALARVVSSWVDALQTLTARPHDLSQLIEDCQKAARVVNDRRQDQEHHTVLNLTRTYHVLRGIFEDHFQGLATGDISDADLLVDPAAGADRECGQDEEKEQLPLRKGLRLGDFFTHSRPAHFSDHYVARLLTTMEPTSAPLSPGQEPYNRGTHPILANITTGMLLYVQLHLSLRSLRVAQRCASMAVLVSHQLHSNTALAVAHYTSFLVHLARGRPTEAADNIAIALQLSSTVPACRFAGGVEGGALNTEEISSDLTTLSLCFTGAAQLLLFYPNAVSASLRALLTSDAVLVSASAGAGGQMLATSLAHCLGHGDTSGRGDADRQAGGSGGGGANAEGRDGGEGLTGGGGGHAVVVQTVPQTVQNALWLSEATAFLDQGPLDGPPQRWTSVVASLHRQTLRIVNAMYGVKCQPLVLDTATLRELLATTAGTAGESAVSRFSGVKQRRANVSAMESQPAAMLLTEASRYTGHLMLAVATGRLDASHGDMCGVTAPPAVPDAAKAALRIGASFLEAIHQCYGPSGVAAAEQNVFFSSVVQYCAACKLHREGYAAAAYRSLTGLALRLYRSSGLTQAALSTAYGTGKRSRLAKDATRAHEGSEKGRPTVSLVGGDGGEESDEETRILFFLRGPTLTARANCSAVGPSLEASSVGARGLVEQEKECVNTRESFYWPPDHLMLLATLQMRRAEVAAYLGYTGAIATMEDALNRIAGRSGFAYGVLASQYIGLLSLQMRRNFTGVAERADVLLQSSEAIGLTALRGVVRARKAAVLLCGGHPTEALRELDIMAAEGVPADMQPWYDLSRFSAVSDGLMQGLQGQLEDPSVVSFLQSYARTALRSFVARGYLNAATEATESLSATDALAYQALMAHSFSVSTPEEEWMKTKRVAQKVRERQHMRHRFTQAFDRPLLELCQAFTSESF